MGGATLNARQTDPDGEIGGRLQKQLTTTCHLVGVSQYLAPTNGTNSGGPQAQIQWTKQKLS